MADFLKYISDLNKILNILQLAKITRAITARVISHVPKKLIEKSLSKFCSIFLIYFSGPNIQEFEHTLLTLIKIQRSFTKCSID